MKEKGFRTVMKIKMKSSKTISEIFSLFELEKKAVGVAEVTLKGYRVNCERLIAYTGDISMDSLTKEEIEKTLYPCGKSKWPPARFRATPVRWLFS